MNAKLFMLVLALLALASPMFAQGQAPAAGSNTHWVWITSGFAMAIASALCGLAQSKAIAAACEGMARNPGIAPRIFMALIVGLAFIESLALYTLVIILLRVTAA